MEAISFASQSITMRKTLNWCAKQKKRRGRPLQARYDIHDEEKFQRFSEMALTLTLFSTGFPQAAGASTAYAEVKKKKMAKKKQLEVMPLEERKAWTAGLPVVADKIPYTDILELKAQDRLKHIIKHPLSKPKSRPEIILAVLDDDRVFQVALPAPNRDAHFWSEWDRLEIGKFIVEAYTPPLPEPPPTPRPRLEFLLRAVTNMGQQVNERWVDDPQLQEVRRKKMELEMQRIQAETEKKIIEKREAEARRLQKEMEKRKEKERRGEDKEQNQLEKTKLFYSMENPSDYWRQLMYNQPLEFALGFLFFVLFYVLFILSHRMRRKDYDDRMKIARAEDEEKLRRMNFDVELETSVISKMDEKPEDNDHLKASMKFMRSGAKIRRAKRSVSYLDTNVDVKFSDVAGLGEIRKELEEIVEFFKYGEMYRRRGTKIPTGILLCGEPGTGKTLLAKAVAGEAGVSFLSISASQFVEMYVGVGASRVRSLYDEAILYAPSVVFIDELDAVGRTRGIVSGSGGRERDATVNQLLTCLDGFDGKGDVITIAATNRPDVLDPALVRPGRFDRKIVIPKPSVEGRAEILQLYAQKKPMADDIDYELLANITEDMVGADLANLIEVAAVNVQREGRSEITTDDIAAVVHSAEGQVEIETRRSTNFLRKLALKEVALAVVSLNFIDLKDVTMVTIREVSGRLQGETRFEMDQGKFMLPSISRQMMLDHITVQLAPRAGDEIWNGADQFSTIWAATFQNARTAAREFVFAGLSDRKDLYGLYDCLYEVNQINAIDVEALKIVNTCYERAKKILLQNRRLVDVMVDELIVKKTIFQNRLTQLADEYGHFDPVPPQLIDIRNSRLAEFQEKMSRGNNIQSSR